MKNTIQVFVIDLVKKKYLSLIYRNKKKHDIFVTNKLRKIIGHICTNDT